MDVLSKVMNKYLETGTGYVSVIPPSHEDKYYMCKDTISCKIFFSLVIDL